MQQAIGRQGDSLKRTIGSSNVVFMARLARMLLVALCLLLELLRRSHSGCLDSSGSASTGASELASQEKSRLSITLRVKIQRQDLTSRSLKIKSVDIATSSTMLSVLEVRRVGEAVHAIPSAAKLAGKGNFTGPRSL